MRWCTDGEERISPPFDPWSLRHHHDGGTRSSEHPGSDHLGLALDFGTGVEVELQVELELLEWGTPEHSWRGWVRADDRSDDGSGVGCRRPERRQSDPGRSERR